MEDKLVVRKKQTDRIEKRYEAFIYNGRRRRRKNDRRTRIDEDDKRNGIREDKDR